MSALNHDHLPSVSKIKFNTVMQDVEKELVKIKVSQPPMDPRSKLYYLSEISGWLLRLTTMTLENLSCPEKKVFQSRAMARYAEVIAKEIQIINKILRQKITLREKRKFSDQLKRRETDYHESLAQAVQYDSTNGKAFVYLGYSFQTRNEFSQAIDSLEQGICFLGDNELDSEAHARFRLGLLYLTGVLNKFDEGYNLLESLYRDLSNKELDYRNALADKYLSFKKMVLYHMAEAISLNVNINIECAQSLIHQGLAEENQYPQSNLHLLLLKTYRYSHRPKDFFGKLITEEETAKRAYEVDNRGKKNPEVVYYYALSLALNRKERQAASILKENIRPENMWCSTADMLALYMHVASFKSDEDPYFQAFIKLKHAVQVAAKEKKVLLEQQMKKAMSLATKPASIPRVNIK